MTFTVDINNPYLPNCDGEKHYIEIYIWTQTKHKLTVYHVNIMAQLQQSYFLYG